MTTTPTDHARPDRGPGSQHYAERTAMILGVGLGSGGTLLLLTLLGLLR